LRFLIGLWLLITIGAALTGPFGTYDALGLAGRFPYWAGVTAGSMVLSVTINDIARNRGFLRSPSAIIGLGLGYGIVVSGLINLLNLAVFPGWTFWQGWLVLIAFVLVVEALIFAVIWLLVPRRQAMAQPNSQGEAAFLNRLKPDIRAPLQRIESQDHYLLVITALGQDLILMRLADAIAELSQTDGFQVHRSHWVARRAIIKIVRTDGRMLLSMRDGAEVPVSRAYQPMVRALKLG